MKLSYWPSVYIYEPSLYPPIYRGDGGAWIPIDIKEAFRPEYKNQWWNKMLLNGQSCIREKEE